MVKRIYISSLLKPWFEFPWGHLSSYAVSRSPLYEAVRQKNAHKSVFFLLVGGIRNKDPHRVGMDTPQSAIDTSARHGNGLSISIRRNIRWPPHGTGVDSASIGKLGHTAWRGSGQRIANILITPRNAKSFLPIWPWMTCWPKYPRRRNKQSKRK